MDRIGSGSQIDLQWFSRKDGYAVIKKEHRADFQAFLTAQRAEYQDQFMRSDASSDSEGITKCLTKEQINELAEKYDIKHMSEEKYGDFIDDLYHAGILSQEDKDALSPSILTKLDWGAPPVSYFSPATDQLMSRFSDADGNLLKWATYRAAWEATDSLHSSPYSDRESKVFGRLIPILQEILEAKAGKA